MRGGAQFVVARRGCVRFADETLPALERAIGIDWYTSYGTDVDLAALNLCRLRRAGASLGGSIEHGDEAVRRVLGSGKPSGAVLDREPRDLVHGRERFSRRRGALVPGHAGRDELAVAPPEQEDEWCECGGREVRRESDATSPLALDHGRPGPRRSRA